MFWDKYGDLINATPPREQMALMKKLLSDYKGFDKAEVEETINDFVLAQMTEAENEKMEQAAKAK